MPEGDSAKDQGQGITKIRYNRKEQPGDTQNNQEIRAIKENWAFRALRLCWPLRETQPHRTCLGCTDKGNNRMLGPAGAISYSKE